MKVNDGDRNQTDAQALLGTHAAGRLLRQMLTQPSLRTDLCSAFIRSEALATMVAGRDPSWGGRCLVRWLPTDLRSGASDFDTLDVATGAGMRLFMRPNFHGKIYAIPPHGMLIGSANLTGSGQGISEHPNTEASILIECSTACLEFVDRLFDDACEVTPRLRQLLAEHLYGSNSTLRCLDDWPPEILDRIGRPEPRLIVDECLWFRPTALEAIRSDRSMEAAHDRGLLGISGSDVSDASIRARFDHSSMVSWLAAVLRASGGEAHFGRLTDHLHDQLSRDPTMQRVEVKQLLGNALAWIRVVGSSRLAVDRPRHSDRVSLQRPAQVLNRSAKTSDL